MGDHSMEYAAAWKLINGLTLDFFEILPYCEQGVYCNFDHTFEHDIDGLNFLTMAAERGNLEAIGGLVELHNVDVDLPNIYGQTPLMIAVGMGQLDAADVLLELGADWKKKDFRNHGLAEHAAMGKRMNPNMDNWLYSHTWK